MPLSHDALDIAYAVRSHEGASVKGVGPDIGTLLSLGSIGEKEPSAIRAALEELSHMGMFRISHCIGSDREGVPYELRDIAKVAILEPMQAYFDEMGI